jgi:hypothetical protein
MKKTRFGFFFLFTMFLSLSAAQMSFAENKDAELALQEELKAKAPAVEEHDIENPIALAWEKHNPERAEWSKYTFDVINQYLPELNQSEDITRFCGHYKELTTDQQIQVWGEIVAGVAFWESSWNPAESAEDGGSEPDDITHLPMWSEGLMQLSYQDTESNPYCAFDYKSDTKLKHSDLHRSILNPYNNLYCGIRTMADLVQVNKRVSQKKGQDGYWSTLNAGDRLHNRAGQIARLVGNLPFCDSGGRMSFNEALELIGRAGITDYIKIRNKMKPHSAPKEEPEDTDWKIQLH